MRDGRRPGMVPDDDAGLSAWADVDDRVDTDGDGRSDTLLTPEGADLLVLTDLDGDGFVDRVLRIGPDGAVRPGDVVVPVAHAPGPVPGSAPAREGWRELLGRLLGTGAVSDE